MVSKKRSSKTPSPVPTDASAALSELLFSLDAPPPSSSSSTSIHNNLHLHHSTIQTSSPQHNRVHEVIDADAEDDDDDDELSLLSLAARGRGKKSSTPSLSPPPNRTTPPPPSTTTPTTSLFIPSNPSSSSHTTGATSTKLDDPQQHASSSKHNGYPAAAVSSGRTSKHHHHASRSVTPPVDMARSQVSVCEITALRTSSPTTNSGDGEDSKKGSTINIIAKEPNATPTLHNTISFSSPSTDVTLRKKAFEEVKSMLQVAEDDGVLNSSTRSLKPYNFDEVEDDDDATSATYTIVAEATSTIPSSSSLVADVDVEEEGEWRDCTPVDAAYEGLRHSYTQTMCIVRRLYDNRSGNTEQEEMSQHQNEAIPPHSSVSGVERLVEDDDELSASASELGSRLSVAHYLLRLDITSLYLTHCCYHADGSDREVVPRRSFVDTILRNTIGTKIRNVADKKMKVAAGYHGEEQRLLEKWLGGGGARRGTGNINPSTIPSAELQVRLCALITQQLTISAPSSTTGTSSLLQLPTVVETLDAILTLRSSSFPNRKKKNSKNNDGEVAEQDCINEVLLPLLQELLFSQILLLGALRNLGQVHIVFFGTRDKTCRGTYPGLRGTYSQDVTKWLRNLATILAPGHLMNFPSTSISENIASLEALLQKDQFGDQHASNKEGTTTTITSAATPTSYPTFVHLVRTHLEGMQPTYEDARCLQDNKMSVVLPRGLLQLFADTLTHSAGHETTTVSTPPITTTTGVAPLPPPPPSSTSKNNSIELPRRFDCGLFTWLMDDRNEAARSQTLEWYICCVLAMQAEYRIRHACSACTPTAAQCISLHSDLTAPSNVLQGAYARLVSYQRTITKKKRSYSDADSKLPFSRKESLEAVELMIEVSETIRTGTNQHNSNFVSRLIASDCDEDLGHYVNTLLPRGGFEGNNNNTAAIKYSDDVVIGVPQQQSTPSITPTTSPIDNKNFSCIAMVLQRISVFINNMSYVVSRVAYHPDTLLTLMGSMKPPPTSTVYASGDDDYTQQPAIVEVGSLDKIVDKSRSAHTLPAGYSFVTPIITTNGTAAPPTHFTSVHDSVITWYNATGKNCQRVHGDFTSCDNSLHVSRAWVLRSHDAGGVAVDPHARNSGHHRLRSTHILDWIAPFISTSSMNGGIEHDEHHTDLKETLTQQQHVMTKLARSVTTTTLSLLRTLIDFIGEVCVEVVVSSSSSVRPQNQSSGKKKPILIGIGHAVKLLSAFLYTPSAVQVFAPLEGEDTEESRDAADAFTFWTTSLLFHLPTPPPPRSLGGTSQPTPLPFVDAWLDINLRTSSTAVILDRHKQKQQGNDDALQRLLYISRNVLLPYLLEAGYLPTSSSSTHANKSRNNSNENTPPTYNWLSDDEFIATMDGINNGLQVLWGDTISNNNNNAIDVDATAAAASSPFLGRILTLTAVVGIVADITNLLFPSSPTTSTSDTPTTVVGLCTFVLEVLNGLVFRQSAGIHAFTAIQHLRESLLTTTSQQGQQSASSGRKDGGGGCGSIHHRAEMDLAYPSQQHPVNTHNKICAYALSKLSLLQGRCFVTFGSVESIHTHLSIMFAQPVIIALFSCSGGVVCPQQTEYAHSNMDGPTQRALLHHFNVHHQQQQQSSGFNQYHRQVPPPLASLVRSFVLPTTTTLSSPPVSGMYAVAMAPLRSLAKEIIALQQQVLEIFSSTISSTKNKSVCPPPREYPSPPTPGPIEDLLHRLMNERWVENGEGSHHHTTASSTTSNYIISSPLSLPGPEIASPLLCNNNNNNNNCSSAGQQQQQSSARSVLHLWGYIGAPIHHPNHLHRITRKSRRVLLDIGISAVLSSHVSLSPSSSSPQSLNGDGDDEALLSSREVLVTVTTSPSAGCTFKVARKKLSSPQQQQQQHLSASRTTIKTTTLNLPHMATRALREASFKTDIVELVFKAHNGAAIVDPLLPTPSSTSVPTITPVDTTLFTINELIQVVLGMGRTSRTGRDAAVSDDGNDGWGRDALSSLLGNLDGDADDDDDVRRTHDTFDSHNIGGEANQVRQLAELIVCVEEVLTLLQCCKVTNEQLLSNQRREALHKLRYGSSSSSNVVIDVDDDDGTLLDILSPTSHDDHNQRATPYFSGGGNASSSSSNRTAPPRHPLVKSARSQLLHYILSVCCGGKHNVPCPTLDSVIASGPTSSNLLPSSVRGISLTTLVTQSSLKKRTQCVGALIADHIIRRMLRRDLVVGLRNTPLLSLPHNNTKTTSSSPTVAICVHPELYLLGRIVDGVFNDEVRTAVDTLLTSLHTINVIMSTGSLLNDTSDDEKSVHDSDGDAVVEGLLTIAHGLLYCSSSITAGGVLSGIREAEEVKRSSASLGTSDTLQVLHHFIRLGGRGSGDGSLEVGSDVHPLPPLFMPTGSLSPTTSNSSSHHHHHHHHHVRNSSLVESDILGRLLSETFIQLQPSISSSPSHIIGGKRERTVNNKEEDCKSGGMTIVDLTEDSDYGGSYRPSVASSHFSTTTSARPSGIYDDDDDVPGSCNNAVLVGALRLFIKHILQSYYNAVIHQQHKANSLTSANLEDNALFALPREHVYLNLDHGSSDLVLVSSTTSSSSSHHHQQHNEVHVEETSPLGTIPWEMLDVCIGNSISRLPHTGYLAKSRRRSTTSTTIGTTSKQRETDGNSNINGGSILIKSDTAQPLSPTDLVPIVASPTTYTKDDIVLAWVLNGPSTDITTTTSAAVVSAPATTTTTTTTSKKRADVVFNRGFYSDSSSSSKRIPHTPQHTQNYTLGSNPNFSTDVALPTPYPTTTCLYTNLLKDMASAAVYWYKGHGYGSRLLNANMLSNLVGIHHSTNTADMSTTGTGGIHTTTTTRDNSNNTTQTRSLSAAGTTTTNTIVLLIGCSTMRHATSNPRPLSTPFSTTPPTPLINIPSSILGMGGVSGVQVVLGSLWTVMDRQSDSFSTRIMSPVMANHKQRQHHHIPHYQHHENEVEVEEDVKVGVSTGSSITSSIGAARLWVVQAPHLTPLPSRRKLTTEARSPYVNAGAFVLYGLPVSVYETGDDEEN